MTAPSTQAGPKRVPQSSPLYRNAAIQMAARIERAILLVEPLSLDHQEVTDKGSINQRAVLARRAHLVDELYAETPGAHVIVGAVA